MAHELFLPLFILGAVVIGLFVLAWAICAIGGISDAQECDVESGAGPQMDDTQWSQSRADYEQTRTTRTWDNGRATSATAARGASPLSESSPALSCRAERVYRVQRATLPARRGDR